MAVLHQNISWQRCCETSDVATPSIWPNRFSWYIQALPFQHGYGALSILGWISFEKASCGGWFGRGAGAGSETEVKTLWGLLIKEKATDPLFGMILGPFLQSLLFPSHHDWFLYAPHWMHQKTFFQTLLHLEFSEPLQPQGLNNSSEMQEPGWMYHMNYILSQDSIDFSHFLREGKQSCILAKKRFFSARSTHTGHMHIRYDV